VLEVKQIKRKLSDANALITRADKGNSIITVYGKDYNDKIHDFIFSNNFIHLTHDLTNYNRTSELLLANAVT
jgi:hypothetical protein